MAVVDGCGEGPDAAYAANLAIACIGAGLERSIDQIVVACAERLRDTCGVGLAVAVVELDSGCITIASVGDVSAVLIMANVEYHVGSTRGIIGGDYERLTPRTKSLSSGDTLALYSNGLDDFFALRETLESAAPSSREQASAVLDRWARLDDEAAILIYRHEA